MGATWHLIKTDYASSISFSNYLALTTLLFACISRIVAHTTMRMLVTAAIVLALGADSAAAAADDLTSYVSPNVSYISFFQIT